jgi:hypothetical protein
MDWDTWSKVIVGALAVTAAALKIGESFRARSARLGEIKTLLEVAEMLPESSPARSSALTHAEGMLKGLITDEQVKRRYPTGIALSLMCLAGAIWAGYGAIATTWWWWLAAIPLLVFAVTGLVDGVVPRERDTTGRAVRSHA